MRKLLILLLLCFGFFSCSEKKPKLVSKHLIYFDLKGYFTQEAERLEKNNPSIRKSVNTANKIETKGVKISNWKQELASFINADINKTSWQGAFKVDSDNYRTRYINTNKKIAIKLIEITRINQSIESIKIIRQQDNNLYQSLDSLIYIPNKLYFIYNQQKIRFMKEKNYEVRGLF